MEKNSETERLANNSGILSAVVVGGDEEQLDSICGLLRNDGIRVRAYGSAESALSSMERGPVPHLIVTDLYMPVVDGWRFCRWLRSPEYARFNKVPVIVLSPSFMGREPGCTRAGLRIEAFLTAPVDGSRFVSLARALMEGRQAQDTPRAFIAGEGDTQALLQAIPDMMFLFDADGVLLDCHAPDVSVLLAEPQRFLGRRFHEVLPEDLAEAVMAHLEDILEKGETEPFGYEAKIGGQIRHHECRMVACADGNFLAIVRDVTAQKRAEAERRLEEERLETLLRLNQMTNSSLDEIARFAMEEAVRLTYSAIGYVAFVNEDETVLTMHAWSRMSMELCRMENKPLTYPIETTGLWGEAVRQRRPIVTNDYSAPNPWKKGHPQEHIEIRRHMNVPVFDGDRIVIVAGVGNKATDYDQSDVRQLTLLMTGMWRIVRRKQAEAALRASETRFRNLLQNIESVSVQGYGPDGTVHYWNRGSEKLYGYGAQEAIGRNLLDLIIPSEMRGEVLRAIGKMVQTGVPEPASEMSLMRKDGSRVALLTNHAVVRADGLAPELFCIDIDLTERNKAEEERQILQAKLNHAQKMESVGRLAGGIAHDFNNMLGVILGYAEMALEQTTPYDPFHAYLVQIDRAARRSADLTRHLLGFARQQTIEPKVLDLNETVEDMLKMLKRLIDEHIELVWKPCENIWPVKMDPTQIDQVLANLCVNARDAISGAGKIVVETGNALFDRENCEKIAGCAPGEYVLFSVSDDGCGMDSETSANMFEPFFTTKETGKGAGLGLATVYGIVKQNKGCIDVRSQPGRGTTFSVYLPRHCGETAPERLENVPVPSARGDETILVVEDEPAILNIVSTMLEQIGYVVLSASGPAEAIRLATSYDGEIHLVVTDVIMPGMNGKELARKIMSARPRIKRLFMSGYSTEFIARHGVREKGVRIVQKPFSLKELGAKVREALDAR